MKKIIGLVAVALLLGGCASQTAYRDYTQAYSAYVRAETTGKTQAKSCEVNITKDTTLPAGFSLTCYQGGGNSVSSVAPPQQIKDSEWTRPVEQIGGNLIGLGSTAIIAGAAKTALKTMGESAGHDSYVTTAGSNNADSHDTLTKDSGNTPTTISGSDFSSGDNRGNDGSVHDSYNPDNSVNSSQNPDNSINGSQNPVTNPTTGNP